MRQLIITDAEPVFRKVTEVAKVLTPATPTGSDPVKAMTEAPRPVLRQEPDKIPSILSVTRTEAKGETRSQTNADMGLFDGIIAKVTKEVLPKITVGGSKADKQAVKDFVESGVADPVFEKFEEGVESGIKTAALIGTAGLIAPALKGGGGSAANTLLPKMSSTMDWGSVITGAVNTAITALGGKNNEKESQQAGPGGSIPGWIWVVVPIALLLLGGKKRFL